MRRWGHNLLVAVVFVLGLSVGIVFNTDTTWLISVVAAVLLVLSLLSIAWPLRWLRAVPENAVAGQRSRLTVSGWALFGRLTVQGTTPEVVAEPVIGRLHQPVSVVLARGVYQSLPLRVMARDLFGWWQKAHRLALTEPLVVGPRPEARLAAQLHRKLQPQLTRVTAGIPGFDLVGLRPYVAGDPMQAIDWKATARTGEPITRQTSSVALQPWQALVVVSGSQLETLLGVAHTLDQTGMWQTLSGLAAGGLRRDPDLRWYAQAQPADRIDWGAVGILASKQPLMILCDASVQQAAVQALGRHAGLVVAIGATAVTVVSGAKQTQIRRVADASKNA